MTDETPTDLATEPDGDLFVQVPTAAWAHDVETRLTDLETDLPAHAGPVEAKLSADQEQQILSAFQAQDARLGRLRGDVELLKSRFNELINYVVQAVPASAAPTPTELTSTDADKAGQ